MFKNAHDAFFYEEATGIATQITDIDYPGSHTYTITMLTSPNPGTVATATTSGAHGLSVNDTVLITGANQAEYNGVFNVTSVPDSTHFTYNFPGSSTSPASTSTSITANGGAITVPGIVFLDGYFVVMDTKACLYNSALNDPMEWNGLDFLTAQIEPGYGVGLAKSQNYIIAFKEWSTEFFFNAANPVGSPFSPAGNGFNLIGCASGYSIASLDGILFWVSQTRQKGRGVYIMMGLDTALVSTPDIERILHRSTLEKVHAFGMKIAGHAFYVLTLVDLNITLVYNMTTKLWATWSSLTLGEPVSVSSIVLNGTTATVTTEAPHGLSDGDPVLIGGVELAEGEESSPYNGIKVASYINDTSYTFEVTASAPATGTITSTPYIETYFKYTKYVHALNKDLLQHESNGTVCEMSDSVYQDSDSPVNVLIRTAEIDNGMNDVKRHSRLTILGNKVNANAYARYSDDDYNSFSPYRKVDLSTERSKIDRLGSTRKRAYDIRHLDNTSLQLTSIDLDIV